MLTIIVPNRDGGITDYEFNQFSLTGRVEGEDKLLISLHNAIVSDGNVRTVHGRLTINSNNTVIGGCKIDSFCAVKKKNNTTMLHMQILKYASQIRHLTIEPCLLYHIVLSVSTSLFKDTAGDQKTYHQLILPPASAQDSGIM